MTHSLEEVYRMIPEKDINNPPRKEKRYFGSTRITFVSMFATLGAVLYIFGFSLPFAFPGFLEFKLSDIPVLIGTFTLGPLSGMIIVAVQIAIKLAIKGTSTMFVGELSDFLTTCAFALPAGVIYVKNRTMKGAIVAVSVGALAEIAVAMCINRIVLIPFYVQMFFGGNLQPLVGMMKTLFPSCTQSTFYTFYIFCSVLPFNALRCVVASAVTFVVYKHISRLINSVNTKFYGKREKITANEK